MKTAKQISRALKYIGFLVLLTLTFSVANAQSDEDTKENVIYWHIKAVLPVAKLLSIMT
jgi:hypothetical protein